MFVIVSITNIGIYRIRRCVVGKLMNKDLEGIWKEAVFAQFEAI